MTLVTLGMALGADVTVGDLLVQNLIPATLGNIIGGTVLVTAFLGVGHRKVPGLSGLYELR